MVIVSPIEKKYLTYVLVVAMIWTFIITSFADLLQAQNIWLQFVFITLVEYALPAIVLAIYLDGGAQINPRKVLGSFFFFMSWDLIFPPLLLDLGGVLHTEGIMFGQASIDAIIASLWAGAGVSGGMLFLATYPLTFLVLQGLVVWLLTGRQLWQLAKI